jgi:predicted DNA-binding ribbon-helix-helix protein
MLVKHSLELNGRQTCVCLEHPFWTELETIAAAQGLTRQQLIAQIDKSRPSSNRASAIRLYVLNHYRVIAREAAGAVSGP